MDSNTGKDTEFNQQGFSVESDNLSSLLSKLDKLLVDAAWLAINGSLPRGVPIEKDLPEVNVDADRIQQVLHNLLGNALQFTPADGHVHLNVTQNGKQIIFTVKDDGVGIASENLPHIFERFYRVDKSRSRSNGGGSGIGLTIAKSLVEAHGGTIRVESAGKNKGSTFAFTIPLD